MNELQSLEDCKKYVREKLEALRPLFAKSIVGDFSGEVPSPKGNDDEFAELYVGIQAMLDVIRDKIADLEMEIGAREELEQRLISRNKELADTQKAMLNVMEDLRAVKDKF